MKRQHPDNPELFWCPKCEMYKSRGEFHKRNRPIGIESRCKQCKSQVHTTKCIVCGAVIKAAGGAKYCSECWKSKEKERCKIKAAKRRELIGKEAVRKESKIGYARHRDRAIRYEVKYIKNRRKTDPLWGAKWRSAYKTKLVLELRDNYLTALMNRAGLQVTPETTELKRQQITKVRELKRIVEAIKNESVSLYFE